MLQAIRLMTVNRGLDPRRAALLALGGSGPLYATELASLLGVTRAIVPLHSGVASALGMVLADFRYDATATLLMREDRRDLAAVEAAVAALAREIDGRLRAAGVPVRDRVLDAMLDLRYLGQGFELAVPLPPSRRLDERGFAEVKDAFHELHQREFGWHHADWPVEIVFARVAGSGAAGERPGLRVERAAAPPVGRTASRECFFLGHGAPFETPVVPREGTRPGDVFEGPLIVEQMDTTTVVSPGWRATVDALANLVLEPVR
jgi:N-methylhydantoinase A